MKMQQVKAIAQEHGIKAGRMKKYELIRAIQQQEGHVPCYATDVEGTCDQSECLWLEDCSTTAKKVAV